MPFSNLDIKKTYYYVLCVMAFFVLMWGTIDFASSSIGLITSRPTAPAGISDNAGAAADSSDRPDQAFDSYYQSKMLSDRFWDSLARVFVAGIIFAYCRLKVDKLEKA